MFQPLTTLQPNRTNSWNTPSKDLSKNKTSAQPSYATHTPKQELPCTPTIGLSMIEGLRSIVMPTNELAKNVLDYFTGIPLWGRNLKEDMCDATVGAQAAGGTLQMIGRTMGSAIGARIAFWIGAASIASGSLPILAAGGALAGGVMLAAPMIGEKILIMGKDIVTTFTDSIRDNNIP